MRIRNICDVDECGTYFSVYLVSDIRESGFVAYEYPNQKLKAGYEVESSQNLEECFQLEDIKVH